jgi:hypothetical protein
VPCARCLPERLLGVAALPGGDTLLQGDIVERAVQSKHTPKFPLLFRGWVEFVLEGFAYHLLFHIALFHVAAQSRRWLDFWLNP